MQEAQKAQNLSAEYTSIHFRLTRGDQEYEQLWRRNISNTTADFMLDEETNSVHIQDGAKAVIGGIIEEKKIKYTKNDKAF